MNINDHVKVTLTNAGKGVMLLHPGYLSEAERAGLWQLWRLMEVFGVHMHIGQLPLFERNEVAIVGDLSAGWSREFSPAYRAKLFIDEDRDRLLDEVRD